MSVLEAGVHFQGKMHLLFYFLITTMFNIDIIDYSYGNVFTSAVGESRTENRE